MLKLEKILIYFNLVFFKLFFLKNYFLKKKSSVIYANTVLKPSFTNFKKLFFFKIINKYNYRNFLNSFKVLKSKKLSCNLFFALKKRRKSLFYKKRFKKLFYFFYRMNSQMKEFLKIKKKFYKKIKLKSKKKIKKIKKKFFKNMKRKFRRKVKDFFKNFYKKKYVRRFKIKKRYKFFRKKKWLYIFKLKNLYKLRYISLFFKSIKKFFSSIPFFRASKFFFKLKKKKFLFKIKLQNLNFFTSYIFKAPTNLIFNLKNSSNVRSNYNYFFNSLNLKKFKFFFNKFNSVKKSLHLKNFFFNKFSYIYNYIFYLHFFFYLKDIKTFLPKISFFIFKKKLINKRLFLKLFKFFDIVIRKSSSFDLFFYKKSIKLAFNSVKLRKFENRKQVLVFIKSTALPIVKSFVFKCYKIAIKNFRAVYTLTIINNWFLRRKDAWRWPRYLFKVFSKVFKVMFIAKLRHFYKKKNLSIITNFFIIKTKNMHFFSFSKIKEKSKKKRRI